MPRNPAKAITEKNEPSGVTVHRRLLDLRSRPELHLQTAQAFGHSVSPTVLPRADEAMQ